MYETENVVWANKRANRSNIATCRRDVETEKGITKVTNRDILPLCGGVTCEPISTKFGVFVGLTDVVTYTKNGSEISNGFSRPTGGKTPISF